MPDLQRFDTAAGPVNAPSQQAADLWAAKQPKQAGEVRPQTQQQSEPSGLDGLWAGLKGLGAGAAQTILGGAQSALGRRGAQPGPRSPGETMAQQWLGTKAGAVEQAYQQDPSVLRNPNIAGASKLAGEIAPAMMMGGGSAPMRAAQSGLSRLAGGALGGAAGAMSAPVPSVDYYKEKLAQIGPGAAVGGAIPAVGGMLSPRLPSMGRVEASAKAGPWASQTGMQKIATVFRPLSDFIRGAEERTKEGFARTVAREALAPIGGKIEGRVSGSDLFDSMREQFGKAYDSVLPNITLTGGHLQALPSFISTMGPDAQRFFQALDLNSEQNIGRMWNAYVTDRFNKAGGVIDGPTFKKMQSDISEYAWRKLGTATDETGQAATRLLSHLNDMVVQQNPVSGPQLQKINAGYRIYALMRSAAGKPASEFKFGPGDMQGALNKASTDEQWTSAKDVLRLYSDAARNRMATGLQGSILPHLFSRHGLPMEILRGAAGPAGRALKTTSAATSPAAGRESEPLVSPIGP